MAESDVYFCPHCERWVQTAFRKRHPVVCEATIEAFSTRGQVKPNPKFL